MGMWGSQPTCQHALNPIERTSDFLAVFDLLCFWRAMKRNVLRSKRNYDLIMGLAGIRRVAVRIKVAR